MRLMGRIGTLGAAAGLLALLSCAPPAELGAYDVTLASSGKLALVTAVTPLPTIAGIESAALRDAPRRCTAKAAAVLYEIAANDRDAVLPATAALRFAGRFPVSLDC
ncbi:hypothetical protein [Loktanella sp. M215]|uniref:hypothetical protein n=1 Tax=Loktanella sp. M215 TaxID=2675431 RepID=UPI001F2CC3F3|nr:hypothetical protein [Loktanella sp. M215]MCF7699780.1 hypothetical protein [Loktanella sp. M215]